MANMQYVIVGGVKRLLYAAVGAVRRLAKECCCPPADCCTCGECLLTKGNINACLSMNVRVLVDDVLQFSFQERRSNLDGDGRWVYQECGEWWYYNNAATANGDFRGLGEDTDECLECSDALWAGAAITTGTTIVDSDPELRIRRNCDTGNWEFRSKYGDLPDVWRSLGAGTCDGVTASVTGTDSDGPEDYEYTWCWTITGASCCTVSCCDISGTWNYSFDLGDGAGPQLANGGQATIVKTGCCTFSFSFNNGPLFGNTGVFTRVDDVTWLQTYDVSGFTANADMSEGCDRMDFYNYGGTDFWVRAI